MKSMTVLAALYNEETGFIEVAKEIVNDDDSVEFAGQIFHPETVEWIAAVYDTSADEAIDFILFEPYVENISPMEVTASVARLTHRTKIFNFRRDFSRPIPYTRQQIMDLLLESPVDNKYTNAAVEDPLDVIRRECPVDDQVVALKKVHVGELRSSRMGQVPASPRRLTPQERILKLKRQEEGSRSRVQRTEPTAVIQKVSIKTIELVRGRRVN